MLALLLLTLALQAQTLRTVCASGCAHANTVTGLQAAIDAASFGDVIEIAGGQTISVGATPPTLRNKGACTTPIVIRSSKVTNLTPGARVMRTETANLATIYADTGSYTAFAAEQGAECYRFHGIEFTAHSSFPASRALLTFGTQTPTSNYVGDSAESQLPGNISVEQCLFHGHPTTSAGPRRGILAHTRKLEIENSTIYDIKLNGNESNAIGGWNGKGPFFIRNNHLEAGSITTLFGGAQPTISGVRANGVFVYGNHYYRPWTWRRRTKTTDPSGQCNSDSNGGEYWQNTANGTYWNCVGGTWTSIASGAYPAGDFYQKNIFELKNAERVDVEGNYFENAWLPAAYNQYGAMFLFNLVDMDPPSGTAEAAATIGHVRIRNNFGRRTAWVSSIAGVGGPYYRVHNNIQFDNNVFDEIAESHITIPAPEGIGSKWGGGFMWMPGQGDHIWWTNNTLISRDPLEARAMWAYGQSPAAPVNAAIVGNIVAWNQYGFQNDVGAGNLWGALDYSFSPGYSFDRNVVVNNTGATIYSRPYPIVNIAYDVVTPSNPMPCVGSTNEMTGSGVNNNGRCGFPAAYTDVGFTSYPTNLKLASGSTYKGWGPGGLDPGADTDVVGWSTPVSADNATFPSYLNFQVRSIRIGQTWVMFRYTAPTTGACLLTMATKPDLSSPTINALTDGGGDRDRYQIDANGLAVNTQYYWKIACGDGTYRRGILTTNP